MSEAPEEDEALVELREVIGGWLLANQLEDQAPLVSAANLFGVLVDSLRDAMGMGAIRAALLMVYDRTYAEPMNFKERATAKELLDQIAQARRKVEGGIGLILPGGEGMH